MKKMKIGLYQTDSTLTENISNNKELIIQIKINWNISVNDARNAKKKCFFVICYSICDQTWESGVTI